MNAECMTLNCEKGTSAYAGPHYQKLYSRVTHARGDRRVQPTEVQWMASPWRNLLLDQASLPVRAALGSMPVPPTTAKNRGILILTHVSPHLGAEAWAQVVVALATRKQSTNNSPLSPAPTCRVGSQSPIPGHSLPHSGERASECNEAPGTTSAGV